MWAATRALYLEDLVEDALVEADRLGGFDSNEIHAEAEVRAHGQVWNPRAWLMVEALPDAIPDDFDPLVETIALTCEELSSAFRWNQQESTLITFLPSQFEVDWMPARWGYFVDKKPYDKICLPHDLLRNKLELRRAVRHEFMHDISWNKTNGHDPRWLSEALATLAEDRLNADSWDAFRRDPKLWLSPTELVGMLGADQRRSDGTRGIRLAYDQASFIARYLADRGGTPKLADLLEAIGNESILRNVELLALNRTRTDGALRHIYRLSEDACFERTLNWVESSPFPCHDE